MPTLLWLKSQVLAAEEETMESEKMHADTEVRCGLQKEGEGEGGGNGRRGVRNGGLRPIPPRVRSFVLSSSFFIPRSTDEKSEPVSIQDANFLLTDVNMRGHAKNRVYIPCSLYVYSRGAHFPSR